MSAGAERERATVVRCVALVALLAGCAADEIVVYEGHTVRNPPHETGGESGDAAAVERGSGGTTGSGTGGTMPRASSSPGGSIAPGHVLPPPPRPAAGGTLGAGGIPVPSGGASGAAGAFPIGLGGLPNLQQLTCSTLTDCPTNFTCAKIDCNAPTGFCQPRPILCDASVLPVCGCDGVTYWNDCVRQQNGVAASTLNQCTVNATTCTTSADCKVAGASCARVNPIGGSGACGSPALGTCWVTPADCTTMPAGPMWAPCQGAGPGQPSRPSCVNTCSAIRSENEHVAAMPGLTCL